MSCLNANSFHWKSTYNINNSNKEKHAWFKQTNKQNPSKTTPEPKRCWNTITGVYIPKEQFLSATDWITFSQINKLYVCDFLSLHENEVT